MNKVSLMQSLGKVSASETGQVFRDLLRGHVREIFCEVMAAEVTALSDLKYTPSDSAHHRAGTSLGRVPYEGECEEVVHPRACCQPDVGPSREIELATYRVAKDPEQLQTQMIQAIPCGVSTRGVEDIKVSSTGVK